KRKEKRIEEAQAVKAPNWKFPVCYDNDDDKEGYNSLNDNIISEIPSYSAVTPTKPIDSLSMGDEHLDTIPATESDKFIKSCVENLVPNPSESEGENGCDVPAGFTTFSNVLFDDNYDSDSSDDQSLAVEDVREKIYSNPLFDEEIIPMEIDQHFFNVESDLIESKPNHDSSITISSKIDSLSMSSSVNSLFLNHFRQELIKLIVILRKKFVLPRDCCTTTHLLVHRKKLSRTFLMLILNLSLHLLSPMRIVTLMWNKLIYSLIRMTQCHRALRKMTMTLKGMS
nr:hypothetical protein [Tanacetum cinerariifolium]